MRGWWAEVPGVWRALVALASAAAVGGAAIAGTVGRGVDRNTLRIHELHAAQARIEAEQDTIRAEYRNLYRIVWQTRCLSLAERQGTPWQQCLDTPDGRSP